MAHWLSSMSTNVIDYFDEDGDVFGGAVEDGWDRYQKAKAAAPRFSDVPVSAALDRSTLCAGSSKDGDVGMSAADDCTGQAPRELDSKAESTSAACSGLLHSSTSDHTTDGHTSGQSMPLD